MTRPTARLLLIADQEDDVALTRRLLAGSKTVAFDLDWVRSSVAGLQALLEERHDVCLIDAGPDGGGLDLLRAAARRRCKVPLIVLTGQGASYLDCGEAVRAGAVDYLVKETVEAEILERVLCHAIERQRAQSAAAQDRQRLRTLIDNLPDAIYFKDAASRFVINNAAHLRILGADLQESVAGKWDFDFFPAELAAKYYADEQRIVQTGEPVINTEELVVGSDRQRRWFLTSKVPLRGPGGGVVGIVGIGRDITAVKEGQAALRQAHDQLEKRVAERTTELSRAVRELEQEIAERRRTEAKLREAEERYRMIFEQAADSIVVFDAQTGIMVEFNDRACENLGYTREEFGRLRLSDFEVAETPAQVARHIQKVIAEGGDVFETRQRTKAGAVRHILVSARPIVIRGKHYIHAIWSDITEQKRVEAELRDAIVHLQQHDQAKSEFVSNVSHELKTPLTSMLYGTRNLLQGVAGALPDAAVRYLQTFDRECQRLVNTINAILDLGRLDSEHVMLSTVCIPLTRLVTRSVEALRIQAEAVQVAVLTRMNPQAGFVKCDPDMIERAVQNILGNAIKFTPAGGAVDLRVDGEAGDPRQVRLEVEDTGIGIPPDALDRVTERYFRVARYPGGSGLGLAISKETVQLHGGTLSVQSPPPGKARGTLVTVRLPAVEPLTVLVVDDDPAVLDLLQRQLSEHGYGVVRTASGAEALAVAEQQRPDAMILDLVLKDMHGCDLIVMLKCSERLRNIPILAVSGANLDEPRLEVLTRFDIPLLPKPWQAPEFLERFENVLMGMRVFQKPLPAAQGETP